MVRRHDLTDHEWELLAPLIPRASTGRPRVEDRRLINGMVYKIRTGISWRDLLTLGGGLLVYGVVAGLGCCGFAERGWVHGSNG
ncbi:transposase [Streptomyces sp. RKCA744]|uniref:transposase n=1 Tax=Streptomyces sp. RKCA744 TaxID=2959340 RepID=UPI0035ABE051